MRINVCIFLGILLLSGCVSQKKFNEMAARKDQAEIEINQLKQRLNQQEILIADLKKIETAYKQLTLEHQKLQAAHQSLNREFEDSNRRIQDLLEQNRTILSASTGERESLMRELSDKQVELDDKQRELIRMENALLERERKLAEMTEKMEAQNQRISALRDRVANALIGFSASDLSIVEKNGRVYVTMSQNLLFPKGSRQIDKEGVKALTTLAEVLAQNQDIRIIVEGHTDTDGSAALNWDLSVTRATAVTQILVNNGVAPTQVTASGRAFYDPVAPNDTEANKTKNRRTEIILAPRLEELFELIRN
jgi:chemotaxis protein MotB